MPKQRSNNESTPKVESLQIQLPSEILEKSEDALFQLKKQLPRPIQKKLNRSKFHQLILEDILKDYSNKNNTRLEKIIFEWSKAYNQLT